VGTRKGAFVFSSKDGRRSWKMRGPYFAGTDVYHVVHDSRSGISYAGVSNFQWGPRMMRSTDLGETWKESNKHPRFPKGSGWSVEQIWHIEPGSDKTPERLYAGVAPAGLFVSDDEGDTWKLVGGLTDHPTRKDWNPGAGGLCLHSILVDPRSPKKLHVGISAVGVLHSEDGGEKWSFQNKNVRAGFLPSKYPVFGQCVHKLRRANGEPDTLVQMNHCGVYRSYDNGKAWEEITGNLPSDFGFSIALDHNRKGRIYAIVVKSGDDRTPPKGHFAVWIKEGNSPWTKVAKGFPDPAYFGTYREGMASDREDPCGVYFGTNTGLLYASRDMGESWTRVAEALPPILSVFAARA
jgi:hypothetical protein